VFWIGTSGWSYRPWRGRFYPEELPARRWLAYYAARLSSVEINATFYRLQKPDTFAGWVDRVPDGFRFAFKASQYLTHTRRLRDSAEGLNRLLDTTVPLGGKRGPMLLQLPPRFPPDPERLSSFLAACPSDLEVAVEFRDPAWFTSEIEAVLRRSGAALVWSDYPGAESPHWDTGPFLYVRRHGTAGRFHGRYGRQALETLATAVTGAAKTEYCYFNNDAEAAAVLDALELCELVEGRAGSLG
jgi:uncharacterized protein YecE (DUF72 family)